jgi:hypothetical protein
MSHDTKNLTKEEQRQKAIKEQKKLSESRGFTKKYKEEFEKQENVMSQRQLAPATVVHNTMIR